MKILLHVEKINNIFALVKRNYILTNVKTNNLLQELCKAMSYYPIHSEFHIKQVCRNHTIPVTKIGVTYFKYEIKLTWKDVCKSILDSVVGKFGHSVRD